MADKIPIKSLEKIKKIILISPQDIINTDMNKYNSEPINVYLIKILLKLRKNVEIENKIGEITSYPIYWDEHLDFIK